MDLSWIYLAQLLPRAQIPPPMTELLVPAVPSLPDGDKQPLSHPRRILSCGAVLCPTVPLCRGKIAEEAAVTQSLLVGIAAFPCVPHIPKVPTCEQAKPNSPNSLFLTIKSLKQISLYGYSVTFGLFILLSSSQWNIFYKFCLDFFFPAIQGYLIFALFQHLLPRLILQLPGNSEFICFVFILVIFEQLYILSPISVSHLAESFPPYFSQIFLMDNFSSFHLFATSLSAPCFLSSFYCKSFPPPFFYK